MQNAGERQDTPPSVPDVLGVVAALHVVPFQFSMSGPEGPPGPTAVHCDELTHETPSSSLRNEGVTLEVSDQLAPFQWSAIVLLVISRPKPDCSYPTAMQLVEVVHELSKRGPV
jgi:hypothetical protein